MATFLSLDHPLDAFHPPRPDAENRFYSVTVGQETGVFSGTENWRSLIEGIPGCAVRSFDTREEADLSYLESVKGGLVLRVQILGDRRVLSEDDIVNIPGLQGVEEHVGTQKWYTVTVGTEPGLYPASQSINPLICNVSGNSSQRWGSYDEAHTAFINALRGNRVIKDTSSFVRTKVSM